MIESKISIIIPAYNDSDGLSSILQGIISNSKKNNWKIIVVNDCSSDNTMDILSSYNDEISIINNEKNMGYGYSIKRGILEAETEWVATMDADGQHRIEDLEFLATFANSEYDAVIGDRTKTSHTPISRKPGKMLLQFAANYISGQKIPDINCGLRILRRDIMLHLLSITSDRFSFSTSTMICLMQLNCRIKYAPVTVKERIGKSNVKQIKDGFYTLLLMNRLIFLFKPLRFILPTGLVCIFLSIINQIITICKSGLDVSDATVLLGLSGIIICFMGLLGDQVSGLRRDILLHDIKIEQLRSDYCRCVEKE